MTSFMIAPNRLVDHDMFLQVRDTLEEIAGDHPDFLGLTWEQFSDISRWYLTLGQDGSYYRADYLALYAKDGERSITVNLWLAAEPDADGRPMPHNYPWAELVSYVLAGGYTQDRYISSGVNINRSTIHYVAGSKNRLAHSIFQHITDVDVPGNTLVVTDCTGSTKGIWGYIDLETGRFVHAKDMQHHVSAVCANTVNRSPQ